VRATGRATWSDDFRCFFARKLPREEVHVRFTYGPILSPDGRSVDGIFCPCTEITAEVVGARRLETLRKLGVKAAAARTVAEACRAAADVLGENPQDDPFAAIYLVDETGRHVQLCAAVGVAAEGWQLPAGVSLADDDPAGPLPLAAVFRSRRPADSADLVELGLRLVGAPWPEPVRTAVVLPISAAAHENLAGLLVAGVGPRRPLDASYRTFLDLVAGHIGTALADARAYEEERKRAEALAELDRVKTTFLSNVSHEFRTPLTLMLGPLEEEVRDRRQLPERRERLELVHRSGLRLLKLVNSLLDFARIEAGRMEAVYEPTDLAASTAELASVFRSAVERAGLRLLVNCPPLSEPVYVDCDMWEKIVLNLLSNAFKFTFKGGILVTLRELGTHAELAVSDSGIGIPESELPRIFERFHRVKDTRARTQEGTGIGLALVQELVKLHGGEVRVQSTMGKGTTFTVSIPTGSAHLPRERLDGTSPPPSTAPRGAAFVEEALRWLPGEGRENGARPAGRQVKRSAVGAPAATILLADDNADMRDYLRSLLGPRYAVVAVPDGQAAFEAALEHPPDLVLADVMMPRLDGFGLLQRLRAKLDTSAIPVILLSARAGEESRVEGLHCGADDYLVKPFSARELLARVGAHLELARKRRAVEEELRCGRQELESLVRERTADLEEANWALRQEVEARTRTEVALRSSEQRLAREVEAARRLHQVSTRLIQADNIRALFDHILDTGLALLSADCASLQMLAPGRGPGGELRLLGHRGFPAQAVKFWEWVRPTSACVCGMALRTARRVVVGDIEACDFLAGSDDQEMCRRAGIRAVQSTPLLSRSGSILGMFSTHWHRPHEPTQQELQLLDILCRQAADLIERRRAEAGLRQSEEPS
jgi:signal transduction histidine kinase/DNA-binding response OmpR family regulator